MSGGDLFGQLPRLRCLSLHQPWATAIALGLKPWETRGWSTTVRGEFAVHAAKGWTAEGQAMHMGQIEQGTMTYGNLPAGAIVALVDLVNVEPAAIVANRLEIRALAWGDFRRGRYAFELANVRPLREPYPCAGRQGWFFLDPPASDAVRQLAGDAL